MRSIGYVFGGRPHNLDDCVDYARSERPDVVEVELTVEQVKADLYVANYLMARFRWDFKTFTVYYDEVFGGCFSHETRERQMLSIDNGNVRLGEHLSRIRLLGAALRMNKPRFDYTAVLFAGETHDG